MCSKEEEIVYKWTIIPGLLLLLLLSLGSAQEKEAILYLEFSDFSRFLSDLQRDENYREFMGSSVIQWYKNTRLGLKFPKRIKEFEDVLGFGLSLKNINSIAGKETGIWIFDIGELEMLMITTISESDYLRSCIARSRDNFGEGKIDTISFYFKKDEAGNREVDFAFLNEHLIISNEPAVFEHYVRRFAAEGSFLEWKTSDFLEWMENPVAEAYDLLLYLSSESIRNTYFTSYWFHGNQEELRSWFDCGVILVTKGEEEITEKRIYHLVDGFAFDSLTLVNVPKLFGVVPENADMVKIRPVLGKEFSTGLRTLMGGGKSMDSLIQTVESMRPLAYGNFAVVQKGEVLPVVAEGFAVVVQIPDQGIIEQFNDIYPEKLRTHKLFSNNMPDFAMEGNVLLFASESGFFKKRKSMGNSGIAWYSFLDFEKFADLFSAEMELLAGSERWRSYENRDFFRENIRDLLRIAPSNITKIENKGSTHQGVFNQRLRYYID
jgi:hypothetical protein